MTYLPMAWFRARGAWIGRRLKTKRRIATLVFVIFCAFLIIAWAIPINYLYTPPQVDYPVSLYGSETLSTYPSVTYEMNIVFAAAGSFSVGNPVHVDVVVTDVNNTYAIDSGSDSYCCVSLTNALNIPAVHGKGNASSTVFADRIPLTSYPNGSYIGSDYIDFVQPGNQNVSLFPTANLTNPVSILTASGPPRGIPFPYNESQTSSVITISDSSATLSIDTTRFIARITFLIGTFSVVLLQPVLEAMILPPDQRTRGTPPQPQALTNSPPARPTESPARANRRERRSQMHPQEEKKGDPRKSE